MFNVCPLCNGLFSPEWLCPNCLNPTVDCGKRDDYTGPYEPYQEDSTTSSLTLSGFTQTGEVDNQMCLHLFYCASCQNVTYLNGYLIQDSSHNM